MSGYIVISELDVLMFVILSKVEKHVPYWESVGTTECVMLQPRCCTDWVQCTCCRHFPLCWCQTSLTLAS